MRNPAITGDPPIQGAAWLADWELPFEGGFTLLSKFSWANATDAGQLCSSVFGRKLLTSDNVGHHGRSMLDSGWARGDNRGILYLRDLVLKGALVSRAGRWTSLIAADNVFRFCPVCLANGYQSALYQIDGLRVCPIHHEPLKSTCQQCGCSSVRYALTQEGFSAAFHCPKCLKPFAGTVNPAMWSDPALRCSAFKRLAPISNWLMRLSSSTLKWEKWDEWHLPLRWHCSDESRRAATLDVLLKAFPPPPEVEALQRRRDAPQVYLGISGKLPAFLPLSRDLPVHAVDQERVAIYKAVRRYVRRQLRGCGLVAIRPLSDEIEIWHGSAAMRLSTSGCPRRQAFLLWRFHFEAEHRDEHRLVLRPSVLLWPPGATIDSAAWAAYCLASFHAALQAFDSWRSQALLLIDADPLGKDRDNARALHACFEPLLSPSVLATFPAVSSLSYTDVGGIERILVIGPADIAATTSNMQDRGLWCDCKNIKATNCKCTSHTLGAVTLPVCAADASERTAVEQVNLAYFVPMIQLRLPSTLDGSQFAAQRDKRHCRLVAENDLEAISLWLSGFSRSATQASYALHIEKALLWCVAQRGIALSAMSLWDVNAFMDFLADPMPRDVWLPSYKKGSPHRWSPFQKLPSSTTQGLTFKVLSSLFEHWHLNGFIVDNPWPRSRWGVQALQEREAEVPVPDKRDAVITQPEWGYIVDAAGPPSQHSARWILLALAYYAALKPSEIGGIKLQDLHRVPSTREGIDIWSVEIPTRKAQRRIVYLMPQVTTLLNDVVPVDLHGFEVMVRENPNVYLMDLLDPPPCPRRPNLTVLIDGTALSKWLKPLFVAASQRAERAQDTLAAQRLGRASLSWLTNALEKHLATNGKTGCDCWFTLGACKLCSPPLIGYLPDRRSLKLVEIEKAMNGVGQALDCGVSSAMTQSR